MWNLCTINPSSFTILRLRNSAPKITNTKTKTKNPLIPSHHHLLRNTYPANLPTPFPSSQSVTPILHNHNPAIQSIFHHISRAERIKRTTTVPSRVIIQCSSIRIFRSGSQVHSILRCGVILMCICSVDSDWNHGVVSKYHMLKLWLGLRETIIMQA